MTDRIPTTALRVLRTSIVFDQDTMPAVMRGPCEMKAGIWGRIRVKEGRLALHFLESGRNSVLDPDTDGILNPRQACRVDALGQVRFDLVYFREGVDPGEPIAPEDELIQAVTAETEATPMIAKVPGKVAPHGLDEEVVVRVVDGFYAKIRSDPLLAPVFNAVIADERWPHHLRTMYDFWSSMLLGTGRYEGRPLPKHMSLPLADAHFIRWLALFRETVEVVCVPAVAALFVDRAERVAQSFRLSLAFHRGEDTTGIVPLRAGESPAEPAP